MAVLSDDMGGITAYAAAVNRGYTGTKEEFEQLMYSYTEVAERAEAAAGNAHESEEASIEAKDIAVGAKNEAVSARDAAVSARDASISAKNNSESARDAAISAKDDTLAAKDAVMSAKSSVDETSANFSDAVEAAISDVNAAGRNQKELAKTHAIDSEAWAVGQREGADVGVNDETYHNNSKYYAEQSALAKSETETARDTAITAKDNAVAAKNEAETAKGQAQDIVDGINAKSEQIDQNAEDISALQTAISTKAEVDGNYEDLVSGGAYQIISNMEEVDNTPYNYRTAGGSLEIGDRMKLKKIVGVSLPVNQLVHHNSSTSETNGVTFTNNGDGTWTLNGEATANATKNISDFKLVAGHKYLLTGIPSGGSATTFRAFITYVGPLYSNTVFTYSESVNSAVSIGTISGYTASNLVFKPQLFDLTLMLGSTIADYVYTLESGTAGAGVAWLKSHFPKIFDSGYIPYNAGTLEHVSGLSAHKMIGFNQWDEEWENGSYDANGQPTVDETRIRTKNPISVIGGATYRMTSPSTLGIRYYDKNDVFISGGYLTTVSNGNSTPPANARYLRFSVVNIATYHHDICINLHWDGERDGEYEPYEEHSYPLDSDVTLRGIPKLDANNNLYYDGDEYVADGTVTRRYGIVDLGTLSWGYNASGEHPTFYATITNIAGSTTNFICPKYSYSYTYADKSTVVVTTIIRVYDSAYSTAASFKAANSGVYLVYELATPTTESADPYTEIQNVSNWGTEEFVTTSLVPVGHETAYQPDLRAKIEVAPESPDGDGLYLMKRENGQNSYVAYLGELPSDPSEDGSYYLKATRASGVTTLSWEAQT